MRSPKDILRALVHFRLFKSFRSTEWVNLVAVAFLSVSGITGYQSAAAQSLDDAVTRQLERDATGKDCGALLGLLPASPTLEPPLDNICTRGGGAGTTPSTSTGGGAATPTTLPSIVQQQLREARREDKKPEKKPKSGSARADHVAKHERGLNFFISGESENFNRKVKTFEDGYDSDIWRLTVNTDYQVTDRIVRRPVEKRLKISQVSYTGSHVDLIGQQPEPLTLLQAQQVMGASSDIKNWKPAKIEIAMGPLRVTGVEIQDATANSATVRIQADQPVVDYKTFVLSDPPRIVIDISGAFMAEPTLREEAGKGPIKQIRASQFRHKPEPIVRVVLDLASALPFQVAGLPDTLQLLIGEAVAKAGPVKPVVPPPVIEEKPKSAPAEQPRQRSVGLWGIGEYEDLDRDRSKFEDGYDSNIWRVTIGADYEFTERIMAGLAFDYYHQDGNYEGRGDFNTDSYGFLAFGLLRPFDQTFVQFYGGYTFKSYDRNRFARFIEPASTSDFSGSPDADYDADQYSAGVLVDYNYAIGNVTLVPRAGLDWIYTDFETYSEKGNSGFELTFHDDDQTLLQTRVGMQTSVALRAGFGVIVPQASVDWRHELKNDQRNVEVSFVKDTRSKRFTYETGKPQRDWFEINAGVVAVLPNGSQVFGNYRTIVGNSLFDSHAGTIGFRITF